jgi:hypothetical protein
MWPRVIGTAFNNARPSVVLPEPDSPTRPKNDPRGMLSETPSTARTTDFGVSSPINAPPTGVAAALTIVLEQDVTGGHTVTWPGSLLWAGGAAPTLSSAGGSVDVVVAVRLADLWLGGVYGGGFA